MDTRDKAAICGTLLVAGLIVLVVLGRHSNPPPKVRAQHISTVNRLSTVSLTMTNASAFSPVHR